MKKVLVVDDEVDNRKTVKTMLEANGYKVQTAKSASDCLEKLEKFDADLILLDIMMPGTPVREIIPKIKTKILYFSVVRTSQEEKEELMKSKNIVGYVQKPFNIDDLLKAVETALKK